MLQAVSSKPSIKGLLVFLCRSSAFACQSTAPRNLYWEALMTAIALTRHLAGAAQHPPQAFALGLFTRLDVVERWGTLRAHGGLVMKMAS